MDQRAKDLVGIGDSRGQVLGYAAAVAILIVAEGNGHSPKDPPGVNKGG